MRLSPARRFFLISLMLSIAIGLTVRFSKFLDYISGDVEKSHYKETVSVLFSNFGFELLITCLIVYSLFILNFYIIKPYRKAYILNLKQIVFSIASSVVFIFICYYLLYFILHLIATEIINNKFYQEFIPINLFISAIVIGCVIIFRVIYQKQIVQLENEILRTEAVKNQLESLKNQISPHFLFNSLAALDGLICEDQVVARKYLNHLSSTLRHSLRNHEKQLVFLKEELDFTDSYLFLIKGRFNENLIIIKRIDSKHLNFQIPPLTIQTLIENAVKHNEISKRKPLRIIIETTPGNKLSVLNNIQKKITSEYGSGIGLNNLFKRYKILTGEEIIISNKNSEFKVEVPLINQKADESPYNRR